MNNLLMYIDQIDQSVNNAEINVLESMIQTYDKAIILLEECEDTSVYEDIFQEGEKWDKFKEDTKAPVFGKKGEGFVKRLLMIIPRLLRKLIDFFTKKFGKTKTNDIDEFCDNLDTIDKMSPDMIEKLEKLNNDDDYLDFVAEIELDLFNGKLTGSETKNILKKLEDKFGKDYIIAEGQKDPDDLDPKYRDIRNWDETMINDLKRNICNPGYDSFKMIRFICDMCDAVRNNKPISEYVVMESAGVFKSYIRKLNSLKNDSDIKKYQSQLSGNQNYRLSMELKEKMITPNLDFTRFMSFTAAMSNQLKTIASASASISSKQSLDDIDKAISSITNDYGLKDGFDATDWRKSQTTIELKELSGTLRKIQKNVQNIQKYASMIIRDCEKLRTQTVNDKDYASILNYVVGRLSKLIKYTIDVSNNYDKELSEMKIMVKNVVKKAKKLKII